MCVPPCSARLQVVCNCVQQVEPGLAAEKPVRQLQSSSARRPQGSPPTAADQHDLKGWPEVAVKRRC